MNNIVRRLSEHFFHAVVHALSLAVGLAWRLSAPGVSRLSRGVWIDMDHPTRGVEPIAKVTDRKGLSGKLDWLACNFTIMDECGKYLFIEASCRTHELLQIR